MLVVVKYDACTVREEVLFLKLHVSSSAKAFDKLRSQTITFSPFWEKRMWSIVVNNHFIFWNTGRNFVIEGRKFSKRGT